MVEGVIESIKVHPAVGIRVRQRIRVWEDIKTSHPAKGVHSLSENRGSLD